MRKQEQQIFMNLKSMGGNDDVLPHRGNGLQHDLSYKLKRFGIQSGINLLFFPNRSP